MKVLAALGVAGLVLAAGAAAPSRADAVLLTPYCDDLPPDDPRLAGGDCLTSEHPRLPGDPEPPTMGATKPDADERDKVPD